MGTRVVYGNSSSSNGWPMVDEGSCTWTTVPGTDVSLEIQNGQPLAILRAFAADFNAYVEPLRDADSACWTAGNSVADSNHLSGTAMDLNWDSHPFQVADAGFDGGKIATIRQMLDFYEGTIWWGNDWDDPKDAMHFQLGSQANGGDIDTYGNPHTQDFIARKIRADGFSTFRRSGQPAPPPPPVSSVMTVPLVQKANGRWGSPSPAWDHLINRESSGDPTIIQQIIDVNSGGNEAEGLFQITPRTWNAHGGQDFAQSPRLATPQQQAIVAARIFLANPSGGDWGAGLPGREDAKQLAAGLVPADAGTQPPGDDDQLSTTAQQQISEIHGALFNQIASQSPFRLPNEGAIWQQHQLPINDDGMIHPQYVEWAARHGDSRELARLQTVAAMTADRAEDAALAQAVLSAIQSGSAPVITPSAAPTPAPVPVPSTAPLPATPTPTPTGVNTVGPAGWVGIVGVILQGVFWLLQQTLDVLPPPWAGIASGFLALMTAAGIYKAPHTSTKTIDEQRTVPAPVPQPQQVQTPAPQPVSVPPPQPAPVTHAAPPRESTPSQAQTQHESIEETLARTKDAAHDLAAKADQINESLE